MKIWSKYWGYIVSIPIIIICIAHLISTITGFSINDKLSELDTSQPKYDAYAKPTSITDRPATEQYVKQRESLLSMSDEQFKKAVEENPDLAKAGVRYDIQNGQMVRFVPSAQNLEAVRNERPPVNDEVYSTPDTEEDYKKDDSMKEASKNKKHQEAMHRKQLRQQKEIYR